MIIVRNGDGYSSRQSLDRTFAHTVHGTTAGAQARRPAWREASSKNSSAVVAGTSSLYPGRGKRVGTTDLRPGRALPYARNEDRAGMTRDVVAPVKTLIKAALNDATAWIEWSVR